MPLSKKNEPEEKMRGHGWKKELILKHIEVKGTTITCMEYDFYADNHPCNKRERGNRGPICGTDHVWIQVFNGKLFWACWRHRICNGPISFETGNMAQQYVVTPQQAVDICRATGQEIPRELDAMYSDETVRRRKGKDRPRE